MMYTFIDMVEDTIEAFMDDLSVVDDSFENYLAHLARFLRWEDFNWVLS